MERQASAPALGIWNAERKFPNLSPHGDGTMTFASKAAYEARLKELNFAEVSQGGLVERPHGNKVIRTISHGARRKGADNGR